MTIAIAIDVKSVPHIRSPTTKKSSGKSVHFWTDYNGSSRTKLDYRSFK